MFGQPFKITGCKVKSAFELKRHEALWVKNNKALANVKNNVFKYFSDYDIAEFTILDAGYYKCALNVSVSKSLILSKAVKVKPKGMIYSFFPNSNSFTDDFTDRCPYTLTF